MLYCCGSSIHKISSEKWYRYWRSRITREVNLEVDYFTSIFPAFVLSLYALSIISDFACFSYLSINFLTLLLVLSSVALLYWICNAPSLASTSWIDVHPFLCSSVVSAFLSVLSFSLFFGFFSFCFVVFVVLLLFHFFLTF